MAIAFCVCVCVCVSEGGEGCIFDTREGGQVVLTAALPVMSVKDQVRKKEKRKR